MTVWPTGSEDHLLIPIAPMLLNVPKNKTHALGHTNFVRIELGSFSCDCTANGFERSSADSICTDFEECLQQSSPCTGPYEPCQNEIGIFRCDCMANRFGRPSTDSNCTDIDECSEKQNPCTGPLKSCQNETGIFRCDCMANRFGRPSADPNRADVDELMNVPKNKTHALGHPNLVRMK